MRFSLRKSYTVTVDGEGAETYGVAVYKLSRRGEENCIYENCDITFNRREMLGYIELWNETQPSLSCLIDLIADIIESNA